MYEMKQNIVNVYKNLNGYFLQFAWNHLFRRHRNPIPLKDDK